MAAKGLAACAVVLLLAGGAAAEEINADAYYPEGPVWIGGALYYAEMTRERVTRWDGKKNRTFWQAEACGPTALASLGPDRLVVLCHLAGRLAVLDREGRLLGTIERDSDGRRLVDPNDVIADGRGGAYFSDAGVFAPNAPKEGRVYHLTAQGRVELVAEGLHYANGLVLSESGGRLFVSEHLGHKVWSFALRPDGSLEEGVVYFDLATVPGPTADVLAGPDGLELDSAGNLYISEYGAGRVLIVAPDGQLRHLVPLPLRYGTNIALSPDERSFVVTAARSNRVPPYRGAVLRLDNPAFADLP